MLHFLSPACAVFSAPPRPEPVILVDNGSRRPAAVLALREVAAALSARLGGQEVLPASLGFSDSAGGMLLSSTLSELVARPDVNGAVIAPLFLGPSAGLGRGVASCAADLPPAFGLRVGGCLVDEEAMPDDTRVARALASQVLRVARQRKLHRLVPPVPLKVLVVDHGTPSRAVNAVRNRLARDVGGLLSRHAVPTTSAAAAFASIVVGPASMERRDDPAYDFNEPLLERALAAPPYDAGDVILAMAFALPGRHAGEGGDVAQIVERAQEQAAAELRVHTTPLLGRHSLVLDVLADRVRDAGPLAGGSSPDAIGAQDAATDGAPPKVPGFLIWLVLVWGALPAGLKLAGIDIPEHL